MHIERVISAKICILYICVIRLTWSNSSDLFDLFDSETMMMLQRKLGGRSEKNSGHESVR